MQNSAGISRLLLVPSLLIALGVGLTPHANAQSVGYSLGNNIFDTEIPAGSSNENVIVIFNNPESAVTPIHIELSLWGLSDDTDDVEFVAGEPSLNAATWFTIENGKDFILEPSEDRNVNFRIDVPNNTPPGSYLVMMRFQSVLPEYYFVDSGPRFIPELGALFFIKVPLLTLEGDRSSYSANIETLAPEGNKIPFVEKVLPRANAGVFDSAIKNLLADIKNDGIYHFKMSGTVQIKNIFGRIVAEEPLPGRYLLPNKSRNIDIAVLPPPNTENQNLFIRFFRNTYYALNTQTYFGPYSAIVTLEVPDGPPTIKSVNFWVVPWQFWITLAIVISGGLIVARKLGRTLRHRIRLFVKILIGRIKPT